MKANNIDGAIKLFGTLPRKWKNHLNFKKADIALQEQEGFFDLVRPDYDLETQTLGEIYWDEENTLFTYPVIDLVIDLEEEKTIRKAELKAAVEEELMTALGVGALEHLILDGVVPQSYKDTVLSLRAWEAQTYAKIDAFTDPKEMRKYKIKSEDVENAKTLLKAGRK